MTGGEYFKDLVSKMTPEQREARNRQIDPYGIELGLQNYKERALIRSVALGWALAYRRMMLDALAEANRPRHSDSDGRPESAQSQ